ncbi:PIN domain-containing protein [Hymenobacter sp. BRD67]|uniref:PIN domain-containing protein n=1 Tax=Hymenobacter sp. BRD67 TaxID=2675877 RepID=UPI0020B90290|nr:PIN domain-containing protein [Hymenobacter sp. BRD67]
MKQYLLDTNICIHYIKGEFGLCEKVDAIGFDNCFLSEITIAELLFGIAKSDPARQAANRRNVDLLREAFEGQELLIGPALETFATEKARRKIGRVVDDFDLLIGATAVIYDLTLVTRNTRHFADNGWYRVGRLGAGEDGQRVNQFLM